MTLGSKLVPCRQPGGPPGMIAEGGALRHCVGHVEPRGAVRLSMAKLQSPLVAKDMRQCEWTERRLLLPHLPEGNVGILLCALDEVFPKIAR